MPRRKTIGFLTANIHTGASLAMWPGVLDAAQDHDVNLLCFPGGRLGVQPAFEFQRNAVYQLVTKERIDGLVSWASTLGVTNDRAEVKQFHERFLPLPMVSLTLPMEGIPNIAVNSYDGMRSAVGHLIEVHGLRKIAFIRGPENHPYAQERFHAYLDVLQEASIPFEPNLVTPPMDWEAGAEPVRLLLDGRGLRPGVDFEGIAVVSDLLALASIEALQARGIRVPADLAVMGFNDYDVGRLANPPLSSVRLSFHEQGYRALDTILAILAGETAPENLVLPTRLVIRQSCGCPSQAVERAAANFMPPASREAASRITEKRDQLAALLASSAGSSGQASQLLESFWQSLEKRSPAKFLSTLEEILQQVAKASGDIAGWQNVISALRKETLPLIDLDSRAWCEDVFNQARVLASDIAQRWQAYRQLMTNRQSERLREIGQELITTFDILELANVLEERLPALGIPSCYLALYEEGEPEGAHSRLVMAYADGVRFSLEPDGSRFLTRNLVPVEFLPLRRYSMVVEPLFFREDQIGFIIFEIGPRSGSVYEVLRAQIASALKGAFLFQEAQKARLQAEKADRVKTRLLANVSHELRTPLNLILGRTTDALKSPTPYGISPPPALLQDLRHIQSSAEHQLRVINDLLDLSRAEINELDLYLELIDPRPLLEDAFQSFSNQRAGNNITWHLELPERLPIINADPVRLRQILFNLLSNAIRFTEQGSITLGAEIYLPNLHLWVADTGVGIAKQDQDRIFEPFVTAEHDGQIKGGIGLGLSITRWLVSLHGGKMALESQPGKGSLFHVYLPLPNLKEGRPSPEIPGQPALVYVSGAGTPATSLEELCSKQGLALVQVLPSADFEAILAQYSTAALAWDLSAASEAEWLVMRRLSGHPRLASIPFIIYGGARSGLTITLVKPASGKPLLDALAAIYPVQGKGPILIVDDDPEVVAFHQKIVREAFGERRILTAKNGKGALESMALEVPGLVLLDLKMPEMDGFEVLDRMRADPQLYLVPVIVLSNKQLTREDIKVLEKHTRVTLQTKGILSEEELAAALQRELFGPEGLPAQTSALVKRVLAFLHQNYNRQLLRWEIAEAIGVSEDYLSRVFLRELGLSLWDYLNRYRINQAKEFLRYTGDSIQAIALKVGFKDQAYFSRVFRNQVGASPSTFRSTSSS
jgi:signal transduction histidine kinase/DNA-binding LacI/PurR family transcriptional regulator/AraC-like DNA-binding protein